MENVKEVIFSSDKSQISFNTVVWDPATGNRITSFKEGNSSGRCLSLIGKDYLISALQNKPILKVWTLNQKSRIEHKFVCPGVVNALAVSPLGSVAVVAIESRLHVWEIHSGNLIAVLDRHYQDVTAIRFTINGNTLVSGGKDSVVLVWDIQHVYEESVLSGSNKYTPRYVWHHHVDDVTDIHVGTCNRAVTVSSDGTCLVYDLLTGKLIFSVYTNLSLTSVTLDAVECMMHLGATNGNIMQVNLYREMGSSLSSFNVEENCKELLIAAHSKPVTCLSTSLDGTMLVSGSEDGFVKVWDVHDKILRHAFEHCGPVTNAFFVLAPPSLLSSDRMDPCLVIKPFKRSLEGSAVENIMEHKSRENIQLGRCNDIEHNDTVFKKAFVSGASELASISKKEVEKDCLIVKQINNHLYSYSVNALLNSLD